MSKTRDREMHAQDAMFEARKLSWAPFAFQTARCLIKFGLLARLKSADRAGLTTQALAEATGVSKYGATVLLEAGKSFGLVHLDEDRWSISKVGYFVLEDPMSRVNMDFVHDVNYLGIFKLDEAIEKGEPSGLAVFGDWPTIYEGLKDLPDQVQKSWFGFDHYYSDSAFPQLLSTVFDENPPRRLMDIGGNTGKWTVQCTTYNPDVQITILDLPGQLAKARANLDARGLLDRVTLSPFDLLDHSRPYPKEHDAIWMSQFLCCFGEEDIVQLLRRAREAIAEGGSVYILETFWDRQPHPVSELCVTATSLYFTALANGNSRMYDAKTMQRCVEEAGLVVAREVDGLGIGHTLFVCERK